MKKILITGASGYIGSELVKTLRICHTLDINGSVDFNIDIRNEFKIDEEYDTVIHLAAKVQVGESVKDPLLYYDTNINGTINVLKGIKTKHFILASTGAAENPTSPYALSKVASEQIVIQHCEQNNIPYTIFRFYNVIGGNPTNPDGLFFALKRAIDTQTFNLYGTNYNTPDRTAIRDYVHVEEICESIKSSISNPSNSIERLGHGKGNSVRQIVDMFKSVNGVVFNVIDCDRRSGDLECSVLTNVSRYMVNKYAIEEMVKL